MAGVGVAVPPHHAGLEERLRDARRDDERAERQVAGGDPLRARQQVGLEPEALRREPASAAAEAGDHLVGDEEHVALAADLLHPLEIALGRREHAAGADHRLAEERRDALGSDLVDRLLERFGRVPVDLDRLEQRAEAGAVRVDAADARAEAVDAVVGVPARKKNSLLRLAELAPVAARELAGGVDRVRAAAREEHLAAGNRREGGDPLRELGRRARRQVAVVVVRRQVAHLGCGRVGDLGSAVADVAVPEARGRVEVALPGRVEHICALAADDRQLARGLHRPHVRERMPVARHAYNSLRRITGNRRAIRASIVGERTDMLPQVRPRTQSMRHHRND